MPCSAKELKIFEFMLIKTIKKNAVKNLDETRP